MDMHILTPTAKFLHHSPSPQIQQITDTSTNRSPSTSLSLATGNHKSTFSMNLRTLYSIILRNNLSYIKKRAAECMVAILIAKPLLQQICQAYGRLIGPFFLSPSMIGSSMVFLI